MISFAKLVHKREFSELNPIQQRRYRMIFTISSELICLCSIIISVYVYAKLWYMTFSIGTSFIIAFLNLALLAYSNNTKLCGHIGTLVVLISVTYANFVVGGTGTPYSIWFYVIPLLAVAFIGWRSLFLYATLALSMIIIFGSFHITPVYLLNDHQRLIIQWANHLVAFFIMVTILYSLMREIRVYEKALSDKNYLLQAEKEKFQHLSRYDQLTNLPNRHYFFQHLHEAVANLPDKYHLTLFYMDLDNLKEVNDVFGHAAGDHLLRQTAKRLQICFRSNDLIARLGGDEFGAIVIHPQKGTTPKQIARRIIKEFDKPIIYENTSYGSSISIGLAIFPDDTKDIYELVKLADTAMYISKKNRISK
ncbi:MAG: GGDEF domain-containing protein [Legionella sp.]